MSYFIVGIFRVSTKILKGNTKPQEVGLSYPTSEQKKPCTTHELYLFLLALTWIMNRPPMKQLSAIFGT